jgi:MAP3K TRAFs-binding domain
LIATYKFPNLDYLQEDADCFTDWVNSTNASKDEMNTQVKNWKQFGKTNDIDGQTACVQKVKAIQTAAGNGLTYNYDLLHVLLNSYKSMNAFAEIAAMLAPVVKGSASGNIYLQQQLALAYNKLNQREEAEQLLLAITDKFGADPETNGLLGAVYKGMMDDNKNDEVLYPVYYKKAVEAYLAGFEADPRDFYPGINALTLMFYSDTQDERFNKFMPLVTYAVERLLNTKTKDYWTQATALELAVLDMNAAKAKEYLASALFCNPDGWMKKTTADNLQKIYNKAATIKSKDDISWLPDIIKRLR